MLAGSGVVCVQQKSYHITTCEVGDIYILYFTEFGQNSYDNEHSFMILSWRYLGLPKYVLCWLGLPDNNSQEKHTVLH